MDDKTKAMDNLIAQDADLIEICPDDLVRRLRVGDYYPDGDIGYHEISPGKVDALCEQAADRIEAQAAEIERLRDYWYRQGKDDQHQVDAERIEHLREALAFYARENSWKSCGMYRRVRPNPSPADIDGGNKARAALEARGLEIREKGA